MVKFDQGFGMTVETYDDSVEFTVPVRVTKGAKTGPRKLLLTVSYETCNASICLPWYFDRLAVPMQVKRGGS